MPRKRIRAKRHSREAERSTWESIFDCGRDFFDELPDIGVVTDPYGRPDTDAAREAWLRFGSDYLQTHERSTPTGKPLWALEEFGEPHAH